jgi:hypothetical protein
MIRLSKTLTDGVPSCFFNQQLLKLSEDSPVYKHSFDGVEAVTAVAEAGSGHHSRSLPQLLGTQVAPHVG